jgi:probable HAF family extracellular repeat protein
MRLLIVTLAALVCASCGGGSSGSAATDPAASASAAAMPSAAAPAQPSSSQATSTSAASTPSSSAPTPSAPTPAPPTSAAPAPTPPGPRFYKIVEIPRLAATGSVTASGVNDQGMVVGEQANATAGRVWMYQQSSGALTELTFDSTENGASAGGITDNGLIAGAEVPSNGPPEPGYWTVTGGAMLLTGRLQSYTQAVAANDTGTIIGNYGQSGTVASEPVVWTPPNYAENDTPLPGLRCDHCVRFNASASAINDGGTIVGSANFDHEDTDPNAFGMHAVEWQNGAITDLGGLNGAYYSGASSINTTGDVVGSSRTDQTAGAPSHAFLYHQGVMTDLGTLSGDTNSSASSINDAGQIVGSSQSDTATRAFLYESGRMYDLNTLLDPSSPLVGSVSLESPVAISSNGWIAVNGTDSNDPGWQRAFLLIPETGG